MKITARYNKPKEYSLWQIWQPEAVRPSNDHFGGHSRPFTARTSTLINEAGRQERKELSKKFILGHLVTGDGECKHACGRKMAGFSVVRLIPIIAPRILTKAEWGGGKRRAAQKVC